MKTKKRKGSPNSTQPPRKIKRKISLVAEVIAEVIEYSTDEEDVTSQPHSSDTESDSESASEVNDKQPSKRECTDSSAQPKMKKRKTELDEMDEIYEKTQQTASPLKPSDSSVQQTDVTSQPHSSDTESDSESASEVNDKQPSKRECTDSSAQPKMKKRKTELDEMDEIYEKTQQTASLYTHTPLKPSDSSVQQTVTCTPQDLHEQIMADLEVPKQQGLLVVAGLPGCDKSKSLITMLNQIVTTALEPPMAPLSILSGCDGMPCCELAAVVSPHQQPQYSVATENLCLSAMEYSFNEHYLDQEQQIEKFETAPSKVGLFKDKDLDSHLGLIYQRLSDNHTFSIQHPEQKANPSGLVEINIWDIRMSRSIYHFLPALWGHLDRSYLWLFLDLDKCLDYDNSRLHEIPFIPENKDEIDRELIMCYHPSLYYFLRYVMLVQSRNKKEKDRNNVCSLFAMHQAENPDNINHAKSYIMDTAIRMGVKKPIKDHITPLQREVNDVEILKRELDSLVNQTLKSTEHIPLSFVFLRSLFCEHERIYVTKERLQSMGHELNMSDDDLSNFCKFFMSSGGIIDVSKIDKTSPYVIVKPMKFLQELDKIFYPQSDIDSQITRYGLVTEKKAKAIFGEEYKFFMDVLVSVDLAIQLTGSQINFEGTPPLSPDCTYYYMPDVRVEPPDLTCDPSALHLLLDINCPLRHLQILFAKTYFKNCKHSSALVLKRNTPVNVTNFRTKLSVYKSEVNFQFRYLGDTVEIHLPKDDPLTDEAICVNIVHACKKMMLKDRGPNTKYAYVMMCFHHNIVTRHILPYDGHCKSCNENDRSTKNKFLDLWNKAIRKHKVPKYKMLKKVTSVKVTSSENELSLLKKEKEQKELQSLRKKLEMAQLEMKKLKSKNEVLLHENKKLRKANGNSDPDSDNNNLSKDETWILKKSPELDDVFKFFKKHSANWCAFGREFKISKNSRTSLRQNPQLTSDGKLEQILADWHEQHPADVTWEKVLAVLDSMDLKRTANEVKGFLKEPKTKKRYWFVK